MDLPYSVPTRPLRPGGPLIHKSGPPCEFLRFGDAGRVDNFYTTGAPTYWRIGSGDCSGAPEVPLDHGWCPLCFPDGDPNE